MHQREDVTLDAAGTARVAITRLPRSPVPQDVLTEVEFRDPNGEVLTAATRVPLWPGRLLVGLRAESWAASKDNLRVTAAVVDLAGKAVSRGIGPRYHLAGNGFAACARESPKNGIWIRVLCQLRLRSLADGREGRPDRQHFCASSAQGFAPEAVHQLLRLRW